MATGAVPVSWIGHVVIGGRALDAVVEFHAERPLLADAVMTFQAQRKRHGTAQQARVHRAVRGVARVAAFDANRAVLVDERSAFIDVALQATKSTGSSSPASC